MQVWLFGAGFGAIKGEINANVKGKNVWTGDLQRNNIVLLLQQEFPDCDTLPLKIGFIFVDIFSIMQSRTRDLVRVLHLWMGVVTGIVIFIVSITGSLYVFRNELNRTFHPWSRMRSEVSDALPPSVLLQKAAPYLKQPATGLEVYPNMPVLVTANKGEFRQSIYLDPKTGRNLYISGEGGHFDFFDWLLKGHRYLWLPAKVGKPIVGASIILYFFILVTGIVLWFPKRFKKDLFKQRLTIKKNVHWKRRNYDLHSVLGFYASLFLMVSVLTGLSFAYPWFSKGVYQLLSNGRPVPQQDASVGKTVAKTFDYTKLDSLVSDIRPAFAKGDAGYYVRFPKNGKGALLFGLNSKPGTYYKVEMKAYNMDFKMLPYTGRYAGTYEKATLADKSLRFNYDIHVGAYGGVANKILALLASLVSASLPVTGILIYLGKNRKKKLAKAKS